MIRRFTWSGQVMLTVALPLTSLFVGGCSSDEDAPPTNQSPVGTPSTGGSAGTNGGTGNTGQGGSSGSAGSTPRGGDGGTAGQAVMGGASGTSTSGGSAGQATGGISGSGGRGGKPGGGQAGTGGADPNLPGRVDPPVCSDNCECGNGIDDDGDGLVDWQFDLGCTSREDGTEGGYPTGTIENGWTVVEPSADTVIIYVSSSVGDDNADGLAPDPTGGSGPKQSIRAGIAALRDGSADWLLLRRGDTWSESLPIDISGRGVGEPLVISSYGESLDRPVLHGASSISGNHVMLMHLALDHEQNEDTPMVTLRGTADVLVEGNRLQGGLHGASCNASTSNLFQDMQIRRNSVIEPLSSGFFFASIKNLLVEDNVIYHPAAQNGNHGMYITRAGNENVVTRGNVIYMGKPLGNGIMQRPGGLSEGNVVVGADWNGITMGACDDNGSNSNCMPPVSAEIRGNLCMDGTGLGGGIAFDISYVQPGGIIADNILVRAEVHAAGDSAIFENNLLEDAPLILSADPNITWRKNQVFGTKDALLVTADDLPGAKNFKAEDNLFYSTKRDPNSWFTIPDTVGFDGWQSATGETGSGDEFEVTAPNNTLGTYDMSIGGEGTTESFFRAALEQARFRYLPEYQAESIIQYFRDGLKRK